MFEQAPSELTDPAQLLFGEKTALSRVIPDSDEALFGLGFGALGKPTGWANQSNQRAGVGKPCKTVQKKPGPTFT